MMKRFTSAQIRVAQIQSLRANAEPGFLSYQAENASPKEPGIQQGKGNIFCLAHPQPSRTGYDDSIQIV